MQKLITDLCKHELITFLSNKSTCNIEKKSNNLKFKIQHQKWILNTTNDHYGKEILFYFTIPSHSYEEVSWKIYGTIYMAAKKKLPNQVQRRLNICNKSSSK